MLEGQLYLVEEGGELGLCELAGEEGFADLAIGEVEGCDVQGFLVGSGQDHRAMEYNIFYGRLRSKE